MKISHNSATFLLCLFGLVGYAYSDSSVTSPQDTNDECESARYGELDVSQLESNIPAQNSHLFACAVSLVVPSAGESEESIHALVLKKVRLANSLAARGLNVGYRDKHGNTLLSSLVLSFLPVDWRREKAQAVIAQGVEIDLANAYGQTALQLARMKGDQEMVELINFTVVNSSP